MGVSVYNFKTQYCTGDVGKDEVPIRPWSRQLLWGMVAVEFLVLAPFANIWA